MVTYLNQCKKYFFWFVSGDHLYPNDPENYDANEAGTLGITIEKAKILDSKPKNRFVYQGGKLSGRSFIQDLKYQLWLMVFYIYFLFGNHIAMFSTFKAEAANKFNII